MMRFAFRGPIFLIAILLGTACDPSPRTKPKSADYDAIAQRLRIAKLPASFSITKAYVIEPYLQLEPCHSFLATISHDDWSIIQEECLLRAVNPQDKLGIDIGYDRNKVEGALDIDMYSYPKLFATKKPGSRLPIPYLALAVDDRSSDSVQLCVDW